MSSSSSATDLNALREKVVSLTVDLQDKSKLLVILENRTEEERQEVQRIERRVNEEYSVIMEVCFHQVQWQ